MGLMMIPSGNFFVVFEHGPVEIVSFPMKHGNVSIVMYTFTRGHNLQQQKRDLTLALFGVPLFQTKPKWGLPGLFCHGCLKV